MGIYIMLSNLTDEGAKTLKANPERLKEVNREVEGMGVKILAQYAVLGPYDFVNIVEAPDNETVTRVSLELSSRGTVRMTTLAAVPVDELIGRLKE
ncbi:MAG: GYD domain superfamily [Candidatus Latescibacterota bacterium]|nr:MAG: GYD domain superfamily [Candidatus Latescibacterota bacterium]HDI00647.1 GYD domain-containing protein [Bacillota bacterium]